MAVFVMNQRHCHPRLLEDPQCIHRIELVGDDLGLAHQFGQADLASREQHREYVLDLDHPDDVVRAAIGHRQQRMRACADRRAQFLFTGLAVDRVEFDPGGHNLAHRAIGEPHDPGHDLALVLLDRARPRGLGEDHLQFLGAERVVALVADPEQAEQQCGRAIEQPDQRCGDPAEHLHRRGRDHCDRLGRAQRHLLGHQFTHHQAEIGGHRDGDGKARLRRPVGRHP